MGGGGGGGGGDCFAHDFFFVPKTLGKIFFFYCISLQDFFSHTY